MRKRGKHTEEGRRTGEEQRRRGEEDRKRAEEESGGGTEMSRAKGEETLSYIGPIVAVPVSDIIT